MCIHVILSISYIPSLTYDEDKDVYKCPKGHGEWTSGVVSAQVYHYNENTVGFGGKGSGKKKVNKKLVGERYLLY